MLICLLSDNVRFNVWFNIINVLSDNFNINVLVDNINVNVCM